MNASDGLSIDRRYVGSVCVRHINVYSMRSKSAILIVLLNCSVSCLSIARAEEEGAIQRLLESLKKFESIEMSATISATVSMRPSRSQAKTWEQILQVKRDGSRALLSLTSKNPLPSGDRVTYLNESILYENGEVLEAQARLDNKSLEQVEGVNDDLLFGLNSKAIAGTQRIDRSSMYFNLKDAVAACWVIGYWPLHQQISAADKISSHTSDDGKIIIDCESIYGHLQLELSKEHDFLPSAISLTKLPIHMSNGKRVAEIDMVGDGELWPKGGVKRIKWQVTVDKFGSSDGFAFPKVMSVLQNVISQQGPVTSTSTEIQIEKCVFRQSFDDAEWLPRIKSPVGHSVTIRGAEHLPYVWNGEKAVPQATSLGDIAASFQRRVWSGSGLIGINLLFLAIVMYLLWKRQATT